MCKTNSNVQDGCQDGGSRKRPKGEGNRRALGPSKVEIRLLLLWKIPDGYKFELLERGPTPEPLCRLMLRVGISIAAIQIL
ncbi:hypothetical protein IFM89_038109 [Coptis chinensis]|uniref:Uncharacterized protein n=1 Tax=Coptis chinensis TaxID=261450 RepID=A0A835HA61_9MAGN|nr:hypothetical protein IFM89_038109 [Coptis chinensis]